MSFRILIRWSNVNKVQGYRIRPTSFAYSVLFHCLVIAALAVVPAYIADQAPKRPLYDELIKPDAHKIVWYDFRKPLPDVEAAQRVGEFPKPRGRELSRDAIIATSPKADSSKQLIWQPVPKLEIRHDIPAPNVVARMSTAVVAPPAPKKELKPEILAPPAPLLNTSPQTPKGDLKRALEANEAVAISKPPKAFVPPPPRPTRPARLTIPVQTAEIALPDSSITGAPNINNPLPPGVGEPSFSKGAAPPPNAPPGPANNAGNAKADIAVASLHPGTGPVPEGSRGGQFSRAPNVGEPATGEVSGSGISVPNLTIKEDRSKLVPPPQPLKSTLYADKVRSIPMSTFSVPLRPSSRTIPRLIDARFQGRDVYTMVIPIENLPRYSGDWILWFAERDYPNRDRPSMHAPVPLRKIEPLDAPLGDGRAEVRVQFVAVINKDGKISQISLLRPTGAALRQAVIQDLASWDFKPATRDGLPVDVDAVIEIPFSLPPELARQTIPNPNDKNVTQPH